MADELDLLEAAGVDLRRVELERGPVFENIEVDGHRRQRWLSKSDRIPLAALPDEWKTARARLIVPVAGELGEEWSWAGSGSPGRPGGPGGPGGAECFIVVGWQGLIREFAADGWVERVAPGRSPFLEAARLIVASLDDIDSTTELVRLRELAPRSTIVLTAGEGGGVVLGDGVARRYHAIPAEYLVDATGAGDVFLAALTAAWLFTGQIATPAALRFAAAAASCSVEGAGVAGVPTRAQVAARLR